MVLWKKSKRSWTLSHTGTRTHIRENILWRCGKNPKKLYTLTYRYTYTYISKHMGWLRLVGSFKL